MSSQNPRWSFRPVQDLRGKKGEVRARQVVETSLILLEGRAAASEKELDELLEQLQEVGGVTLYARF